MAQFIPPSFNLPLAWSVDFAFPWLLKMQHNIEEIVVDPEDRKMLRTLRHERLIYLSNHPSTSEPPIAYYIANIMGTRFRFMAARKVFDQAYGFVGKVIQSLGAFSVIAGATDREAIKTAREILAGNRGKLALFPEGEPTSGENDSLLPLQPGVAQLGLRSLEEARKSDLSADILVLPAFVKYIYTGTDAKIKAELFSSLRKIEDRYKIDPENKNLLRRFLTIGGILLRETEAEYEIDVNEEHRKDYEFRIGRVRHTILDNIGSKLNITGFDFKADAIVKLRQVLTMLEVVELELEGRRRAPQKITPKELEWAHGECKKAYNFIVINPDYLISRPTTERFYEWLYRFESHVFGATAPRPRRAVVRFATSFKLSEYFGEYTNDKKEATMRLTTRLRSELQLLLDKCLELTEPIVRPYDLLGEDDFEAS